MDEFDISESGTHVALVEYSTEASVQLKFNDFSGAFLNAANVKRRIDQIPHNRGLTYIDKALRLTNREVFTAEGGMRQNVTKVNIFCLCYFFDKIRFLETSALLNLIPSHINRILLFKKNTIIIVVL